MTLPGISGLARLHSSAFTSRLRQLGIDRAAIRRLTLRGDDLRSALLPTREAAFSDDPAAIAVRLMFCHATVSQAEARAALGEPVTDELLECGLLCESANGVEAPFHLRTARGLYLFSDYLGSHPDAVMGAGETTAVLFGASLPAQPVGNILDLGCGAGTLALLLAASARRVLGTDINPRAVALAQANAAINGIANAGFRAGDLYEPAGEETFDLIVSQPPYYPASGATTLTFLHGGPRGDELPTKVMLGIPPRLAPGGRALIFTSWPDSPPVLNGMRVLEIRAPRDEVNGAHQSIAVIEHGSPWYSRYPVAADCWGNVTAAHIDQLMAIRQLLNGPDEGVRGCGVILPPGARLLEEDGQRYLRFPEGCLHRFVPLDEQTWNAIRNPAQASLDQLRRALERGLLVQSKL